MFHLFGEDTIFHKIVSSFINSDARNIEYTLLTGGLSDAKLYYFSYNNKEYVIRIFSKNESKKNIEKQAQIAITAGKIGVGPRVYYLDPDLNGMIMQFIRGGVCSLNDFDKLDSIQNLSSLLKTLHSSKKAFPIAFCPFKRFKQSLVIGKINSTKYPPRWEEVCSYMTKIEEIQKHFPVNLTPTHLDLNVLNILQDDQKFSLVDWENGGMADPYLDLAIVPIFLNFSNEQKEIFLCNYFGREPTEYEKDRLSIFSPVRLFLIGCNYLIGNQDDFDYELTFDYFLFSHSTNSLEYDCRQIGFVMVQKGLEILDSNEFKTAYNHFIDKYCF